MEGSNCKAIGKGSSEKPDHLLCARVGAAGEFKAKNDVRAIVKARERDICQRNDGAKSRRSQCASGVLQSREVGAFERKCDPVWPAGFPAFRIFPVTFEERTEPIRETLRPIDAIDLVVARTGVAPLIFKQFFRGLRR